jgi:hypothetical protein
MPRPEARPYDQYLDGQAHRLRHGTDFTCQAASVARALRRAAARRNLRAVVSQPDPYTVTVRAAL